MIDSRTCLECGDPKIAPGVEPDTRVCRECELERQAAEPQFPDGIDDGRKALAFIEGSGWRLARTMLDIPHQYTVRDLSSPGAGRTTAWSHVSFEWFVRHIRENGIRKTWGPYENTYLVVGEWEYWTMGFPVEETTIVNRQAVGPAAREAIDAEVSEARAERR